MVGAVVVLVAEAPLQAVRSVASTTQTNTGTKDAGRTSDHLPGVRARPTGPL